MKQKKILPKQKLFVDLYFKYKFDTIKAYMESYETSNYGTANVNGWKLLNENLYVKDYVTYKQSEFARESEIDKEWVKRKLKRYVETYDEIQELSLRHTLSEKDKERIQVLRKVINGSEAARFLDMVNKLGGFYEPDKINITQEWNISFDDDNTNDN